LQKASYITAIENSGLSSAFAGELNLIYRICRVIPLPSIRQIFHASEVLLSQGELAVRNSHSGSQSSNIFATIVGEVDKGETTLTDLDIQIEAGNLILAGSDTTANTLTYLTWSVLKDPALRQLLEDEVSAVQEPLSDIELEKLPILGAVIDETLRLYCAAPGTLPRIVPRGGAVLANFFVPEGVTVGTQAYTIHRDPRLFPDPEK